ncbi:hypothetical protein F2Q68_00010447 [Brassica cretica]|uniref:Uncharacterized protein n=1 Tax=Brassica cretica TaxID=69181 RepID=A0A8S9L004_BRACR|nr:hypothetical protein F2Q68_00010447 [Brassica cretica]
MIPSDRTYIPSKLARGVVSCLIIGIGCSIDRSVFYGMMSTALLVSTRISRRRYPRIPARSLRHRRGAYRVSRFRVRGRSQSRLPALRLRGGDGGLVNRSSRGIRSFVEAIDLS